jgi:membrane-bound lytic murein transglycosylase
LSTNPDVLLHASRYALRYFESNLWIDRHFIRSRIFEPNTISRSQVEKTLEFIIKTIKEDKKSRRKKSRINDPTFLKKHFAFIKWKGDVRGARRNKVDLPKWFDEGRLKNGKIKLTSYAMFRRKGSYCKTEKYSYPLYGIASKKFHDTWRLKFSKQKIFSGVLEEKRFARDVKPMVWVRRDDVEEALMQGSIIIIMPNGKRRLFNAFKSNGFVYDKKIKDRRNQKKYWFFREIKKSKDAYSDRFLPFLKCGGAAFAGDLRNIGLGKIIALKYQHPKTKRKEFKLGVLADRGSAFSNNLYQLDLFSGIFNSRDEFKKYLGQFPPSVNAYILKKK